MALSSQKIKNLERLQKKLRALPNAVRERIKKAMGEVADDIVRMAKSLVPTKSFELQKSIGWTWGDAPKGSISLAAVSGVGGAKDLTITIYAGNDEAFYARWIEFGTAPHSVAKGGGTKFGKAKAALGGGIPHPGTSAQPFFFVSYRANRKRGKSKITRAINKAAKDVAAGKL